MVVKKLFGRNIGEDEGVLARFRLGRSIQLLINILNFQLVFHEVQKGAAFNLFVIEERNLHVEDFTVNIESPLAERLLQAGLIVALFT